MNQSIIHKPQMLLKTLIWFRATAHATFLSGKADAKMNEQFHSKVENTWVGVIHVLFPDLNPS